ncbi:DNA repair protein RecN [Hufsiella ginkgonis]|uniref:DNA repair protein RecN n=1 Tax=Hufsiella ginkgonis TaxID=2695274 RepID=A0A7K1XUW3_9SPHI|nr:DNA repair protein RecN [Hufsiella ginkgonis]MXV14772.1 DNA repair protein RecN [Hufsiella ginkgonis]
MLNRLSIRNYALIDNLDISFSGELNILTGETGAGKSIILGALSLILGQRTDSRYFFNQQKKCVIEGFFRVSSYGLIPFFTENDLDYEEETVLRREISADGRSRAFINDTPVTLPVLKQLGEQLIDIHSQHATLEINDEAFQLLVVDALAGHQALLGQYQQTYKDYRAVTARLNTLVAQSDQSKSDLDYYQFQYDELDNARLADGEQQELEKELDILAHAEEIKRNLTGAMFLLSDGDQSALPKLKEALQALQQAAKYTPGAGQLGERLNSSYIEIKDIAAEIDHIDNQVVVNEQRSATINDRLAIFYNLQKKHRVNSVEELIVIREEIAARLDSILFSDAEIEKLKAESEQLKAELTVLSDNLSASRNEVIPSIEQKVREILVEVGMPNALLRIGNQLLPDGQFNANGRNLVRFLFSANKGQEPAPMNKVASGGELSRLMLSIKSLISRHTALPTIIFDEIDTGISGETALKVGTIMEKLAGGMQVIAITHLPQIASKGKAHYKVYKDDAGERTLTNIALLSGEERVKEVATMLSGANPGEFALQNARELLG